jgi:hypothetical protein
MNRALATMIGATLLATVPTPPVWADPADSSGGQSVGPAQTASGPDVFAAGVDPAAAAGGGPDAGDPIVNACRQFGVALNVAAANYEEFAYATAGNGNTVDYQDPNVGRTNVVGRTALRSAAATALAAARTPGLPAEVSDPITAWSLRATKLLVVMGLHGGGDSLNSNATELNSDAHDAQMACATHGARA